MLEQTRIIPSYLETLLLTVPLILAPTPAPSLVPALLFLWIASLSTIGLYSSATCGALVITSLMMDGSVHNYIDRLLLFLAAMLFALTVVSLRMRQRRILVMSSAAVAFAMTLPFLRPATRRTFFYASLACLPFSNTSMARVYNISDFEVVVISLLFGITQVLAASVIPASVPVDRSIYLGLSTLASASRAALTIVFTQTFASRTLLQGKWMDWVFLSVCVLHLVQLHQTLLEVFQQDPFLWLLGFLSTHQRWSVLCAWTLLLGVSLPVIGNIATSKQIPLSVIRKLFHFLACLLFAPVLILDSEMMNLSFCIALSLLILLETARFLRCSVIFEFLEKYYSPFCGDSGGKVTLHHIYLLGGCALPSLFYSLRITGQTALAPFLGILTLCIGDSFVSLHHGCQLYLSYYRALSSEHTSEITVFDGRCPRRHWRALSAYSSQCLFFTGFFISSL